MILQALKAELYQCRGGHVRSLQGDLEKLSPEAQRMLLLVIRDLKQEAASAKSKARQGIFW
jgi:hypothetical protein